MSKKFGEIKITETEDGFHVDVKGKKFGQMFSRCCMPVMVNCGCDTSECCPPEKEKKD